MSDSAVVRHRAVRVIYRSWRTVYTAIVLVAVGIVATTVVQLALSRAATSLRWWHVAVLALPFLPGTLVSVAAITLIPKEARAKRYLLDQCLFCSYPVQRYDQPCPECGRRFDLDQAF